MAAVKETRKSTVLATHADRLEPTPKFLKVQLKTTFALVEKVCLPILAENSLAKGFLLYSESSLRLISPCLILSIASSHEYPQVRRTFPQRGRRRPFDDEAASANDQIRVPWLHELAQEGL